ncbi:MAG: endonuclease III domain-containing protein [Zetaproteobacteria bacterium]|nr:MAG: endonuclease III domain-containing protein [Zetaproteobacteria bacterium]
MELELLDMYRRLYSAYGPQHWWPADSPFEVCIGAILTQNTNWSNVEKAIKRLRHATALDPESLNQMPSEQLMNLIRPAGFYRQKCWRLKAFIRFILDHGGLAKLATLETGTLRSMLLAIHGIGPETADSMLLYAWTRPVFVVDAYTKRLLARLGFLPHKVSYDQVQCLFHKHLPRDADMFNEFHALIVEHAKQHCRHVPRCHGCPLGARCIQASERGDPPRT